MKSSKIKAKSKAADKKTHKSEKTIKKKAAETGNKHNKITFPEVRDLG